MADLPLKVSCFENPAGSPQVSCDLTALSATNYNETLLVSIRKEIVMTFIRCLLYVDRGYPIGQIKNN